MSMIPVIIIGAPRSGTNMLRDSIAKLPSCATWPCDEINFIWRHGHTNLKTDIFPPKLANSKTRDYIQSKFEWVASKYKSTFVVEKTCANSLRVGYLHKLLPEAKFVFIYRNGLDVVASAMKRWRAPVNIGYLAKKVRFVPGSDLPFYAHNFLLNRLKQLNSKERKLAVWGPVFQDVNTSRSMPLDELCALQWSACVNTSARESKLIPASQKVVVTYEKFVNNSKDEMRRIAKFLGVQCDTSHILDATSSVTNKNICKGKSELPEDRIARLYSLIGDTLDKHGA